MLEPGDTIRVSGTFTNNNLYGPVHDVEVNLSGEGLTAIPVTSSRFTSVAPKETVTIAWDLTVDEDTNVTRVTPTMTATYQRGETKGSAERTAHLYVKNVPQGIAYLSDLGLLEGSYNGHGPMERDMHNGETNAGDGGPIMIDGVHYTKGLGTNSNADLQFYLGGRCTEFYTVIGIDDTMTLPDKDPDVVVRIYADEKLVHESPVIDGTEAYELSLPVAGAQQLRLTVDQYDDNNWYDRTSWGDAKVFCTTSSNAINAIHMESDVERYEAAGEFSSESAVRSLKRHLTAVARYENKEKAAKVVKHMESFKLLLDHQRDSEFISEKAYNVLQVSADSVIENWQ